MKPIYTRLSATLALTLAVAGCAPKAVPPPVAAPPAPTRPPPAPAPVVRNWMDAPQSPGDWTYRPGSGGGTATFGEGASEPRFSMRCDRTARTVILSRTASPSGASQMTVRTESQTRTLVVENTVSGNPAAEARLAATDRLLDAMALSKGRFAVEVPGTPPLYLPSWAEVTRVIEDCR